MSISDTSLLLYIHLLEGISLNVGSASVIPSLIAESKMILTFSIMPLGAEGLIPAQRICV